ncbi:MAG: hypothetical protein SNJ72_02270 [Fimbriimonadales bacterium]
MKKLWKPIGVGGLVVMVAFASAQTGMRSTRGTQQPDDGRIPIAQAVQQLADKFKVQIFVDPLLTARVKPVEVETLEAGLDQITAQTRDVVWRKVHVNKVLGAEPNSEQVINATRALLGIELGGVIAINPRANTLHSFVANYPMPQGFEQSLEQMQPPFDSKPIYVVLTPRAPGGTQSLRGTPTEQFAQVQQQMMELLAKMSPEERRQALQSGFYSWMNADPELRNMMIFEGMRMSFEYWQTLSPEQQREMMEMGRKWFEQYFGGGGQ